MIHSPELRHFPAGLHVLLPAMMLGARGVYDSWVLMNPPVVLEFFALCELRRWEEAIRIEWQLGRFLVELEALGPERVLFGSDQNLIDPRYVLGTYYSTELSPHEAKLVLSENTRRIFHLS